MSAACAGKARRRPRRSVGWNGALRRSACTSAYRSAWSRDVNNSYASVIVALVRVDDTPRSTDDGRACKSVCRSLSTPRCAAARRASKFPHDFRRKSRRSRLPRAAAQNDVSARVLRRLGAGDLSAEQRQHGVRRLLRDVRRLGVLCACAVHALRQGAQPDGRACRLLEICQRRWRRRRRFCLRLQYTNANCRHHRRHNCSGAAVYDSKTNGAYPTGVAEEREWTSDVCNVGGVRAVRAVWQQHACQCALQRGASVRLPDAGRVRRRRVRGVDVSGVGQRCWRAVRVRLRVRGLLWQQRTDA